ncbi:MAG: hypothetical protein H6830_06255 [Planctomycetes bacterium]|nr:hypothetical protein [Planctomycetota bacterium]MCB9909124.1 hypothetical protein [Planctomycetota bacterium]MCB9911626.1 hypothetical protein [Planctomycetota bacterium]
MSDESGLERIAGIRVAARGEANLDGMLLRGVSLGGIRTCLELPALDLLVDLGSVDHRQVYASTVLITHPHLDHLGGLANHMALRSLMGQKPGRYVIPPAIEADVQSLLAAWRALDRAELDGELVPLAPGTPLALSRTMEVEPFATRHRVPSQGYLLRSVHSKLDPRFQGLQAPELSALREAGVPLSHIEKHPEIAFSGDTTIEGLERHGEVLRARRLVMEATFLDDRVNPQRARQMGHVHLDDIAERADAFACEHLVLTHFSLRHDLAQAASLVSRRLPKHLRERVLLL